MPPKRYIVHKALVSSIRETSNCTEEERCDDGIHFTLDPSSCSLDRCDTLMEDDAKRNSKDETDESIMEYKWILVYI